MRSILLSNGTEYGTNDHDGGVFLRAKDGSWVQCAGTGQTPAFRTVQQFRQYLRRHCAVRDVRIIKTQW